MTSADTGHAENTPVTSTASYFATVRHTLRRRIPRKAVAALCAAVAGAIIAAATLTADGHLNDIAVWTVWAVWAAAMLWWLWTRPATAAAVVLATLIAIAAPKVTWLFTALPVNDYTAGSSGVALYLAWLIFTTGIAVHTSYGRPWLTVALTAAAGLLIAPFGLLLAPKLGFLWVVAATVPVLWLRSRRFRRTLTTRTGRHLTLTVHAGRRMAADPRSTRLVTKHLHTLPAPWTVVTDRVIGTERTRPVAVVADHIAVGPPGVAVIVSTTTTGALTDDPTHGITIGDVHLSGTIARTVQVAAAAGNLLHVPPTMLWAVLVTHQTTNVSAPLWLDLPTGPHTPTIPLVITPATALTRLLTIDLPALCNDRQVAHLTHRAWQLPDAATVDTNDLRLPQVPLPICPLVEPPPPAAAPPSDTMTVVFPGDPLILLTDDGPRRGWLAASTVFSNPHSDPYVLIRRATDEPGTPLDESVVAFPYPAACLRPANTPIGRPL